MNIKSLLLGSAAAFAVVTGAKAADVVVAQPEPVEYVKVCDAYGAGFFYIPGTETCLHISGYMFLQIDASKGSNAFAWDTRSRVNFDAREETELGTLGVYIRFQQNFNNGYAWRFGSGYDSPVTADEEYIDFLGFRMGYTESAWYITPNGGASNGTGSMDWYTYGWRGYQERDLIEYSATGANGVYGTISLEDHGSSSYMPDVVGVLGVGQAWGGLWGRIGYDERTQNYEASIGTNLKIPGMPGDNLHVIGYYASGQNRYCSYNAWNNCARWSIMGMYNHQFSSKFTAGVGAQYWGDVNGISAWHSWAVEADISYSPVKNFSISSQMLYSKRADGLDTEMGFLRFTRSF